MKKLFLPLLFCVSFLSLSAQNTYKAYAELLGFQKGLFSRQVKVNVDFGQNVSFWKQGDMRIVDENGKDVVFNSMVDAMDFMGQRGWEFVQAYVVTEGNQNVYHWLLVKEVTCDDDIKAGFNVKADLRQSDKDKYTLTYLKKTKLSQQWDVVKTETKPLSPEEVTALADEWKSQSSDNYDYDCQIKRDK